MPKTQIRRSWAVVAVFAMIAGVALVNAMPSRAADGFTLTRYPGTDRYDTAKRIAIDTYGTSDWVILVSGETFPDALSAGFVAGLGPFPILLTQKDTLPSATNTAITQLGATNALLVGGTSAISQAVENDLAAKGIATKRVAGINRYDTAKEAAESGGAGVVGTTGGPLPPASKTAIVVSGEAFPDALSAGPMAFNGHFPILLTPAAKLAPEAKTALTDLAIKEVLIVGGTAAVSKAVEDEITAMGITVDRLAGTNRSDTAGKVADFELASLKFDTTHVDIARGDGFADALAAASHSGKVPAPLLLTQDVNNLSSSTKTWLNAHSDKLKDGHIFGGTSAVSQAVADEATAAGTTSSTSSSTSSSLTILPSSSTSSTSSSSTTSTTALTLPTQPCPPGTTGPGQPFCSGTPTTAGSPTFTNATYDTTTTAGTTTITLTYSEAVKCSSVDPGPNSSSPPAKIDYAINISGTSYNATAKCPPTGIGTTSTTVSLTLTPDYVVKSTDVGFVRAQTGGDGNTVQDSDNNQQSTSDLIYFTAPHMKTATVGSSTSKMTITYDQPLDCSTVDGDGSDYVFTVDHGDNSPTAVSDTAFDATCSGKVVTLTLTSGAFSSNQDGTVKMKGDVKNPSGTSEPQNETINWT